MRGVEEVFIIEVFGETKNKRSLTMSLYSVIMSYVIHFLFNHQGLATHVLMQADMSHVGMTQQ